MLTRHSLRHRRSTRHQLRNNRNNTRHVQVFWKLSPENGLQFVDDDSAEFEKRIQALENAADSAAADLSEIPRYTRLIRGALDQLRKETEND